MSNDIIGFLLGVNSFDGSWFGDKHPTEEGNFWWRKHLRRFINENQGINTTNIVEQSERLVCGHPKNKTYLIDNYYYCEQCKGKWKAFNLNI